MSAAGQQSIDIRIQAVRIACQEESGTRYLTKQHEIYQLMPTHEIFTTGDISPLSALVRVPVRILKLRPSLLRPRGARSQNRAKEKLAYGSTIDGEYFENPLATALMQTCKGADGQELTETMAGWDEKVGSVLVARADGKPLKDSHLYLIIGFFEAVYQLGVPTSVEELTTRASPVNFSAYCGLADNYFRKDTIWREMYKSPPVFGP